MMKQIVLCAAEGKTIRAVRHGYKYCLVTFTDGTFAHIKAQLLYEDDSQIEDEDYDYADSDVSHADCIAAGLFTEAELEAMRAAADASWKRAQEARERAEFDRLAKKYGSPPPSPDKP